MQSRSFCALVFLVCIAVAFTGCTDSSGSSGTTSPATTGGNTGSTVPASDNLEPSPTEVLPSQNTVTVDINEKDYLGNIPVIFQGGMGQIHVKKIDVTVYRADGQVRTATIGTKKGDMAEIEGTKQSDRVVVYITFDNGDNMKTNDVMSPYRTRG
ncbi:MAG: hypothetical protein M0Q92_13280 [Methanoregula sp.]|jgi:hypothetical protein|nr:hypothetical protein [Methanoregula sp.]